MLDSTLSTLLDDARKRRDRIDTAVSAFRDLPFEEQLQFLVTVEDEIVVASGAAGAVLSIGAAKRPALPAPEPIPVVVAPTVEPPPAPAPPSGKDRKSRYGPEMAARVCGLFDQGFSQGEICAQVGISYPTVNKMLRSAGRNTSARTSRRTVLKSGPADPEESHAGLPQLTRSQSQRPPPPQARPRSQAVEPPRPYVPRDHSNRANPRPLGGPAPLLTASEEIDLARRLDELELAAWDRVLGTPAIVGHAEVADAIRYLTEPRTGVPAMSGKITATALRRADPNRRVIDRIMEIVARVDLETEPPIADLRGELRSLADQAREIRDRFVRSNIRLVGKLTQKFLWTKLDHEELMQEGLMGLMHSIGIYDYRRGLRFSTYATWWIKHAMMRSWENSAEVRIPVHLNGQRMKIYAATKRLKKELHRDPTEIEIAVGAGLTLAALHKVDGPGWWITGAPKSFDAEYSEDGSTFGDRFADPESEVTTVHRMMSAENAALVTRALARLSERDQDILRRRAGMDGEPETHKTIAESYGLSRERVRQLEGRALGRLRRVLQGIGIDEADDDQDDEPRLSFCA